MAVDFTAGTPLADALNSAIQGKIAELGWAGPGAEGAAMSEYLVLMLQNGKTEDDIAREIAGDLLGLGPEDQTAPEFARWLFGQIAALKSQFNSAGSTGDHPPSEMDTGTSEAMDGVVDHMEMESPVNAPTGPKAMRSNNGIRGGREKRMMGQINRTMDRTQDSVLHRVRGQSGTERIGRGPPTGPRVGIGRQPRPTNARAASVAAGLANMGPMPGMPGMPGMQGMPMPGPPGGPPGMNPMNGGFMAPDLYAMMEHQNRLLQQMQQQILQQQQNGHKNGQSHGRFDRGRGGNFRRGGAHHQHNGSGGPQQQQNTGAAPAEGAPQGEDVDMTQAKRDPPNPDETVCRFNLRCTNPECKFAHQSPAAPPGVTLDLADVCSFGAACKNKKCVARHPSPATKIAHQSEQDCKFFPNCSNPHCPFRHPPPVCRNGGECQVPNCKFTHLKTPCRYRPCTNRACPFVHEEGQRGTFHDKVWTADGEKGHVSERKFVDENAPESLVLPGSGDMESDAGVQVAVEGH